MRLLRKCAKSMNASSSLQGLNFVYMPPETVEVVVFIDVALIFNKDKSSQLGILIILRNVQNVNVNVVHFTSSKSKRVCKAVLAAEFFSQIDGFDIGYTIANEQAKMMSRKLDLVICTDSQSLHKFCISLTQTTEHRL